MQQELNIIRNSTHGWFGFCNNCKAFHLVFNNFMLCFNQHQMTAFMTYLEDIDASYWESECYSLNLKRCLPIPTAQKNLILLIDRQELEELKHLVFGANSNKLLSFYEIDYNISFN